MMHPHNQPASSVRDERQLWIMRKGELQAPQKKKKKINKKEIIFLCTHPLKDWGRDGFWLGFAVFFFTTVGMCWISFSLSLPPCAGSSELVAWKTETEGRRDLNEKSKHYQQRL